MAGRQTAQRRRAAANRDRIDEVSCVDVDRPRSISAADRDSRETVLQSPDFCVVKIEAARSTTNADRTSHRLRLQQQSARAGQVVGDGDIIHRVSHITLRGHVGVLRERQAGQADDIDQIAAADNSIQVNRAARSRQDREVPNGSSA